MSRQQLQKNGGGEGGASMSSMSSMSETIMLHNIPTLTDPQKDLAVSAGQEFEKGNYSQCLSIMTKLLKQRSCDPKVVHNHTVAAFYHSNQCSVRELKDGLNSACKLFKSSEDPSERFEDGELAVLYYNLAVCNYHLRHYHAALSFLDSEFRYIEFAVSDETLTQKIVLLWVELLLCIGQPDKALPLIRFFEKCLTSIKSGQSPSSDKQDSSSVDPTDEFQMKLSLFKTRCFSTVKSLKSCKREVKLLLNSPGGLMGVSVQFVRAYFECLRANTQKALKLLQSVSLTSVQSPGQNSLSMLYNNMACVYHEMRRPFTAVHNQRLAWLENERFTRQMRGSNKGVQPLMTTVVSRHPELLYNMGIVVLHCRNPSAAFDCLIQVVPHFQANPRLWLRLAECCIMSHRENNEQDSSHTARQQVIQDSVGIGIHHKLILGSGVPRPTHGDVDAALPALTMEFASLCLSNALHLLPPDPLDSTSAPSEQANNSETSESSSSLPAPPSNPLRQAEVSTLRCSVLAASAYVALCLSDHVVALSHARNLLQQPRLSGAQCYVAKMYIAEALVCTDRIADAIGYLNSDQVTAADLSTLPPEMKPDSEKVEAMDRGEKETPDTRENKGSMGTWLPRELQRAKAYMQHNLAVAHASRSEHDKASVYLAEAINNCVTSLPVQMCCQKLYLDLIEGRKNAAQSFIQEHFGHMSLSQFNGP